LRVCEEVKVRQCLKIACRQYWTEKIYVFVFSMNKRFFKVFCLIPVAQYYNPTCLIYVWTESIQCF